MAKSRQEVSKNPYNPKAHAPAVYIPCWLIQIPSSKLSHQAKLLYGRLAQWSSEKGDVHRAVSQLSQEIGVSISTIERTLKELRDVGLIETKQRIAGGINHFKFLHHPWMEEQINKNLSYQHEEKRSKNAQKDTTICDGTPTSDVTVPHVRCDVPKIKEIKINKKEIKRSSATNVAQALSIPSSSFNRFWSIYPRKKDKLRAWEIWNRNGLDEMVQTIIDDIVHRKTYDYQWKEPAFVPYAKNYLAGKQWEDEIERDMPRKSSSKSSAFAEAFFSKPDKELFDEHGNVVDFG